MALIYEKLKKSFFDKAGTNKSYSDYDVSQISVDRSFSDNDSEDISPTVGFFDVGTSSNVNMREGIENLKMASLSEQRNFIDMYRTISTYPDVSSGISEIVNEIVFSTGSKELLQLNYRNEVSEKVQDLLQESLEHITHILNFELEAFNIIKTWFIDGQLIVNPVFDNNDMSKGITKINILSPINFYYDMKTQSWAYIEESVNSFTSSKSFKVSDRKFKREEIIKIDSGIYREPSFDKFRQGSEKIVLSELQNAIKSANQLKTSEDMLIPMRFSRSVSRRVFNVDIGDLSHTKGDEALNSIKNDFKYNKFYDVETGTISNQNHVATLVEDYWFQNRSGARGTSVDVLDETGNLGELGDILYFKRKLYTSMQIPKSRVQTDNGDSGGEWDATSTSIERDEVKFFAYIQRLRRQFVKVISQLMLRHIISQGKMTLDEWNEVSKNFNVVFSKENIFLENLEMEVLEKKLSLYDQLDDKIGKEFSYNWAFTNILKLNEDEIKNMSEQIENEKNDSTYSRFYDSDEDSF